MFLVGRREPGEVATAGYLDHRVGSRSPERLGRGQVEPQGSAAAAEDQDHRRVEAEPAQGAFSRDAEELFAGGHADPDPAPELLLGGREGDESLRGDARCQPVHPPWHRVLLVQERRYLHGARRHYGRGAGVAADPEDRRGTQVAHQLPAPGEGVEEEQARPGAGDRPAREALQGQAVQCVAGARDEHPLDAPLRADELDGGSPLLQAISHAERGNRVPPGTAAGDKYSRRCGWAVWPLLPAHCPPISGAGYRRRRSTPSGSTRRS